MFWIKSQSTDKEEIYLILKPKPYPYGVHVRDMKSLSMDKPIEVMPAPEEVSISVSQHIGAPAIPVVNIGDEVKKGQLIAEASGAVSANVYSSVCGNVIAFDEVVNPMGVKQKYIRIKNNYGTEEVLFPNLENFTSQELIERIRLAGIVGLGGAGFPTAIKLMPKNKLDTLVINGAECDPYLNCDYRLMLERTDDIIKGIHYFAQALDVDINNIVIGIEKNKPEAIKVFNERGMKVVALKKQYPMGSEKHLIYCCTGRKVPTGKLPADVGCSVQNIKTLIASYEAIELNKPLTEIVMSVSGYGITEPKNLKVAIGTPFKDIVNFCGGEKESTVKYVAGGPMMGKAIPDLNQYARKTDSGLLLLTDNEVDVNQPTNCINCGKCAKNCPMRLMPMYIDFYTLAGEYDKANKYGAMNCIECGSCAYNCPAHRSLVQSISYCKAKLREKK